VQSLEEANASGEGCPTPAPSLKPTPAPSSEPTPAPSSEPTPAPSSNPTRLAAADVVVGDEEELAAALASDAATIELDGTITLTAPIDVGRSVTLVSGVIDGAYATTCVTVHAAVEFAMVGVTVRRCASLTGVYTSDGAYIFDDDDTWALCEPDEAEQAWRMWGTHSCDAMQAGWKVCTNEDDANHATVMSACPATCANYRDDPCPTDYTYVPVGAGVACSSGADCAFDDCTFEKNMGPTTTTNRETGRGGGAVACFGEATCAFRGTTFDQNHAYYGGAVHCEHATCAFEDCTAAVVAATFDRSRLWPRDRS
jgi:hypothetical protein